jgi:hypothetical protein
MDPAGRLPRCLNGWKKHCRQKADNCDDDEQLDERKAVAVRLHSMGHKK